MGEEVVSPEELEQGEANCLLDLDCINLGQQLSDSWKEPLECAPLSQTMLPSASAPCWTTTLRTVARWDSSGTPCSSIRQPGYRWPASSNMTWLNGFKILHCYVCMKSYIYQIWS